MLTLRTKLILVGAGAVISIGFYWLATHAFISITVQNAKPGTKVNYSLLRQDKRRVPVMISGDHTVRRLVSRGSYEILSRQSGVSHVTVARVGGFLGTTEVSVRLRSEQSRKFIGNNPSDNMVYDGGELLSYTYGDDLESARIHKAATADQPTVVDHIIADTNGAIEGYAKTKSGRVLLLRESDGEGGYSHAVYQLNPTNDLGAGTTVAGLNGNVPFEIAAYRDGFLVFDTTFHTARYYANTTSKPVTVTINTDIEKPYEARDHSIMGDAIAVVYGSVGEGLNTKEGEAKRHKTIVAVKRGASTEQYKFTDFYGSVELCGSNKLCMLGDGELDVFDISGAKPHKLYSLGGVTSFTPSAGSIIVARKNEIFSFNVNRQEGYIGYDLAGYEFCGLDENDTGYTLCLSNNRQRRVALQVENSTKANDYIDKKVFELLRYAEIDDVSIFGNYISIVPELGPMIYNPSSNDFGPDPVVQKRVNATINQAITKLEIDRSVYSITTSFN